MVSPFPGCRFALSSLRSVRYLDRSARCSPSVPPASRWLSWLRNASLCCVFVQRQFVQRLNCNASRRLRTGCVSVGSELRTVASSVRASFTDARQEHQLVLTKSRRAARQRMYRVAPGGSSVSFSFAFASCCVRSAMDTEEFNWTGLGDAGAAVLGAVQPPLAEIEPRPAIDDRT